MATLTKTRKMLYYTVKLSPNVEETPEGYLIFRNAVIARTGFQKYKGIDLPEDELLEQGITVNPDSEYELYRSESEVFAPETIASFLGKHVTDKHPPELLDIDNLDEYNCGTILKVWKGTEPLEDGNWPLLADIQVTNKLLIQKWRGGIRELSCGYNYHVILINKILNQVDILGNHVAFVENGRAGTAKVLDSASIMFDGFRQYLIKTSIPNLIKRIK